MVLKFGRTCEIPNHDLVTVLLFSVTDEISSEWNCKLSKLPIISVQKWDILLTVECHLLISPGHHFLPSIGFSEANMCGQVPNFEGSRLRKPQVRFLGKQAIVRVYF